MRSAVTRRDGWSADPFLLGPREQRGGVTPTRQSLVGQGALWPAARISERQSRCWSGSFGSAPGKRTEDPSRPVSFLGNKRTAGRTSAAVITAKPCDAHGTCERRLCPTADTPPVHVSWARSASLTPPTRGVRTRNASPGSARPPASGSGLAPSSPWGPARRVSEAHEPLPSFPGSAPEAG